MRFNFSILSALAFAASSPALAADVSYTPPPQGSPLYVAEPITGDISGSLGWISVSSVSSGAGSIGGRINIPLHDGWNLEPDVGLASVFNPSVTVVGGVVHLYKKLPNIALGVFGGGFNTSASSSNESDLVIGGEAAVYTHPNSIFGGQVSFNSGSSSSLDLHGYWDYFFSPDLKVTADAEWTGGSPNTTVGTLAVTKRWTGTQWSGFVSGSVATSGGTTGFLGLVGITRNFDPPGTTQYQHDRYIPFKFASTLF